MARAVPADKCGVAFGLACGSAAVEVACGKLLVLVKQWVDSRFSLSRRRPCENLIVSWNLTSDVIRPGRSDSESYGPAALGANPKDGNW